MKQLLIIGNGSIAKKHNAVIKKIFKKIKIFYVKNKKIEKSLRYINNLISTKNINLALVCSPTNTHLEYIKFLKKSRINYLVEKPIIKDDQLKKVNKFLNSKSKIIELVGYQLRFNKILLKMKKLLSKKVVGEIRYIKIIVNSYLPNWRKSNLKNSLSLSKKKGGGVLLELSHEIDYMLWLFGRPKFLKAIIDSNNIFKKNIDERVNIFFKYNKKNIQMDMSLNSNIEERKLIVEGSKGALIGDILNKKITLYNLNKKKIIFKSKQTNADMLKDQMIFLLNSIKKENNFTNVKDSIKVIKIISLIRKSNQTNKIMRIQ